MRRKRIMPAILAAVILFSGGCFKQEEKKDIGIGVSVIREGATVKVVSTEDILGGELEINRIITEGAINSGDYLKIVRNKDNKTIVSVVDGKEEIKAGKVLFAIENTAEKLEVRLNRGVKSEEISYSSEKRGSLESLLGDFNGDDKVNITDYNMFLGAYGSVGGDAKYDVKYDISMAAKGITKGWENIYATNTPDSKINIFDFITFGANYGMTKPVSNVITAQSISISGVESVEVNKTITLNAMVKYSDLSEKMEVLDWKSSDATVALYRDWETHYLLFEPHPHR